MRSQLAAVTLAMLGLALAGCSSTPTRSPGSATLAAKAADQAWSMRGKPYRYGGNTPRGFDCSGLVQYSYARVGVSLPHSTEGLRRQSTPIESRAVQRGDLLFFNQEGKRSSHVGIYLGDNRFVHAPSTGKNVNVGNFSDPYWRRHFAGARRLLLD